MKEIIVQMAPLTADGEHKLVVLTSAGRMFERVTDPRNFDQRNGRKFLWKEVNGPLDEPVQGAV